MGAHCDIVIPVWNNLDITKDCINSIRAHTGYPYRIVIVDNASDAPTQQYLDSLEKKDSSKFMIIHNEENKGFVKAVNQGMRFSNASYMCVMNNDTIVTDGWLEELINILSNNDNVGLVNPSSNTSCQFPGKLDIDTYARTLKRFKGTYQELYTCRAFAMVVKRKVIEKIGYLNDIYGMGYFDDTDYSKRSQQLGYLTVRAKASYVYHKESQSFSKVKEKGDIFIENENKFNAKWGRMLRIAYVLPDLKKGEEVDRVSTQINQIAKTGHQVWIFTKRKLVARLKLIDHESIRFYCYPAVLFRFIVLYKIWKRKKKKKLHMVLTNKRSIEQLYKTFVGPLACDILSNSDFKLIEQKIYTLSFMKTMVNRKSEILKGSPLKF